MNLIEEIAESRLSFYIISDVNQYSNELSLLKNLRYADYENTNERKRFLSLEQYERKTPQKTISSYIGLFNNCLIIKDIGIHSDNYIKKLTRHFPNNLITRLVCAQIEGHESVTGGILQSFRFGKLVLHLRKIGLNNNDVLFDASEEFIPKEHQSTDQELNKSRVIQLINDTLESILNCTSLDGFEIQRYNQIRFLDFQQQNNISKSIHNYFPKIDDSEISSAWVANMLRGMVSEDAKLLLFPSAKEINQIIANIINDLIDESFQFYKSRLTFRRKKKKFVDEIIIGGSDRTGFSLIFKKSFKAIEKQVHTIEKSIVDEPEKRKVAITKFVKTEMETELRLGKSWHNFATQLYYHLKCGFDLYYPLFENLEDMIFLNQYVNHSDNWFTGGDFYRINKKPLLQNYIVAIEAGDKTHLQIMEEKVLEVIEDSVTRNKYRAKLEKLKPADNNR